MGCPEYMTPNGLMIGGEPPVKAEPKPVAPVEEVAEVKEEPKKTTKKK